jgi:outer membrane protein OmpA-like peptidoglycan-associated protein
LEKIILITFICGLFLSSCSDSMKRLYMTTGLGCGTGLAFGAVYDEMQRSKDNKERKKLENQVFNVFKKRKAQNKGKIVGLATGCLAGLGTGLYLNMMKEDIQENFGKNGIELEEVKDRSTGETVALRVKMDGDISFENGKSDLKGTGKDNVAKLSEALAAYPETNVGVFGHANRTGPESGNLRISRDRAEQVVSKMTSNGIARNRITTVQGLGSSTPLEGVKPADGINRRVEVKILPGEV